MLQQSTVVNLERALVEVGYRKTADLSAEVVSDADRYLSEEEIVRRDRLHFPALPVRSSCLSRGSRDRFGSIRVKSPKLYLADTGLLCALLNIRSVEMLRQSPAVGAVWETFVFAQLRDRERRGGRTGSLFFWRDRTREVDFVVDTGGRLELFEAKWTELPDVGDTVNLDFVRNAVGKSRMSGGAIVCRTPNSFPLANGFRALPVTELRLICPDGVTGKSDIPG